MAEYKVTRTWHVQADRLQDALDKALADSSSSLKVERIDELELDLQALHACPDVRLLDQLRVSQVALVRYHGLIERVKIHKVYRSKGYLAARVLNDDGTEGDHVHYLLPSLLEVVAAESTQTIIPPTSAQIASTLENGKNEAWPRIVGIES